MTKIEHPENLPHSPSRAIVFDLDGTVINSLSLTFAGLDHAFIQLGMRPPSAAEISKYFGRGELDILRQLLPEEQAVQAMAHYSRYLTERCHQADLHQGIRALLDRLKADAVPVALFTGRGRSTTEILLDHHKLHPHFKMIVTHDDVTDPKPSPEGLNKIGIGLGLSPAELLFIGDSPLDIRAAHYAGSVGIAALWDGLARREELEHYKPHYFAKSPGEIWDIWVQKAKR